MLPMLFNGTRCTNTGRLLGLLGPLVSHRKMCNNVHLWQNHCLTMMVFSICFADTTVTRNGVQGSSRSMTTLKKIMLVMLEILLRSLLKIITK